jgi:hypothetical protein
VGELHTYEGACHCGAIRVSVRLTKPAGEIQVRACQCGFCTRHGAMTVSDPEGQATFEIAEGQLAPYQFATRSGTILLCRTCGVYAGMLLEDGGKAWSVANVRGLAIPAFKNAKAEPVVYDAESAEGRIARRMRMWTPTLVSIGSPVAAL